MCRANKNNIAVTLTGENPKDEVGALVLLSILPGDVRDKVALYLDESLSVEQIITTAGYVNPFERLFGVKYKLPGIHDHHQVIAREDCKIEVDDDARETENYSFFVGDKVFLKDRGHCMDAWTGLYCVTQI